MSWLCKIGLHDWGEYFSALDFKHSIWKAKCLKCSEIRVYLEDNVRYNHELAKLLKKRESKNE